MGRHRAEVENVCTSARARELVVVPAVRAAVGLVLVFAAACGGADQGPMEPAPQERDEQIAWLQAHAVDMEPSTTGGVYGSVAAERLDSILGSRDVIVVGEPTHGDGSIFRAKVDLIKHLYLTGRISTVVWEASLFGLWRAARSADTPTEFVQAHLRALGLWERSDAVMELLEFAAVGVDGRPPLRMVGMDFGLGGFGSEFFLDLEEFRRRNGFAEGPDWSDFRTAVQSLASSLAIQQKPATSVQQAFRRELALLAEQAAAAEGDPAAATWSQVLRSLGAEADHDWLADPAGYTEVDEQRRDRQMASNALWHLESSSGGAVVWSANLHALRSLGDVSGMYGAFESAGELLDAAHPDRVFIVATTGYQGSWFRADLQTGHEVPAPRAGSFEDLMGETRLDVALVGLRALPPAADWLGEPLSARPLGYDPMTPSWPPSADAFLFVRELVPP